MIFAIITTTVGDRRIYREHLQAHHDYLAELSDRGVLAAAGPFDDHTGSMTLVEVDTLEDAISIARNDPLVRVGVDRYQVRRWNLIYDAQDRLEAQGTLPQLRVPPPMPIAPPPSEGAFTVVDATEDPEHADVLVRCFAPETIAAGDPTRHNFLRLARPRGLRKLLLLSDETVAGQLEYAPAGVAGLPIEGEGVVVVHCLWITEAHTGLDGGQRLLAECVEANPEAQSLATVAFTSTLKWLPRSFYERQGFAVVDELETGRFFGDTPIVAYLMWRPLKEGAARPAWVRDAFLGGVDFCPAYPWMVGRRLYWGRDYAYRAIVVQEGLRRPEILEQFPVLATQRVESWTMVQVGFPAADLPRATKLIQAALVEEPTYYAYLYPQEGSDEIIVVFPFREYRVTRDPATWAEAVRYGLDKGIPRDELLFDPSVFHEAATKGGAE
ncbi:MAG: hypothetical protein IT371_23755 [Deltaproteobacteria bacterium]|nr:hypothetical protein [Deltaproteobacteria bacterium]